MPFRDATRSPSTASISLHALGEVPTAWISKRPASMDAGRFDIHAAGTSPSARRLIDAGNGERVASRKGIGYPAPHYDMAITYYDEARAAERHYGTGAKAKLVASGLWTEELTYQHRYVSED